MRRLLPILMMVVALLAAACGDDTDVSVGDGPDEPTGADDTGPDPDDDGDTTDDADDGPILGAGPYPIADLTFRIQPDGADGETFRYQLACLGDTATVVVDGENRSGEARCLALLDDAVRTRLIDGPPADQICTEIYGGPQIATVTGTLDGATVDTSFHRNNGCGIADWALFAEFLPDPT